VDIPVYCSFKKKISQHCCPEVNRAYRQSSVGKVVMDYFLEDKSAMLTLSDSENESDNEEIPDLGQITLIEPDIVGSSDDNGGEETVSLSRRKLPEI
jgi:hypothetical protein